MLKIEFVKDWWPGIEVGFCLAEALVAPDTKEDDCDLNSFGVPAVACRRSGLVWLFNMLFGNILTLSGLRLF